MPLFTTLGALSQTAASNPPDGSVDQPSTIDDQLRLLGSFIAQLRDGSGFTGGAVAPTGTLFDYAGTSVPTGFLACDGSAVSRTTYAALFTAIGTAWGAGDGSTTFTLPDLRRRTTIGAGGTSVSGPANTVGAVGGEETHDLTTAELATHNHAVTITDPTHGHTNTDGGHAHTYTKATVQAGGSGVGQGADTIVDSGLATGSASSNITVNAASTGITAASANAGSGTAHNNMQPSAVVNKIIKT